METPTQIILNSWAAMLLEARRELTVAAKLIPRDTTVGSEVVQEINDLINRVNTLEGKLREEGFDGNYRFEE
jgi:hypothetical protein